MRSPYVTLATSNVNSTPVLNANSAIVQSIWADTRARNSSDAYVCSSIRVKKIR